MEFLSPYSPLPYPIEDFFSAWKVYDCQPHTQMTLLAAMDAACDDALKESVYTASQEEIFVVMWMRI